MALREVADGRFVHLHIATRKHPLADLLVNESQPMGRHSHPHRHRLPRQPHSIPAPIDGLLPIERNMVAVFADEDLREQPRGHDAALQQRWRQWGHDGNPIPIVALDILRRTVRWRRKRAGS